MELHHGDAEWIGTTLSFMLLPGDKKGLLSAHPEIKGQIEQQGNDKGTLLIVHHDGWKNYTPLFAECSLESIPQKSQIILRNR